MTASWHWPRNARSSHVWWKKRVTAKVRMLSSEAGHSHGSGLKLEPLFYAALVAVVSTEGLFASCFVRATTVFQSSV